MMHRNLPRIGIVLVVGNCFCLALLGWPATGFAQVSAEESARMLKPAAGLEATLWAAEPMVVNATNMEIDSRGRVWVTEGLNYRLTRGGNKKFARIEEADRIKILEDTDGDGKADKVTVFADRIFPVPMGIALEENYGTDGKYLGCKVYIGNSPNLLVLEDTNGDDRADKRYPLLTGFGGIDSDHGVHGMILAPDGKLYFTQGDGCCSVQPDKTEKPENFNITDNSGRHVSSSNLANTLRANRDGTQFEILADRQRNNYETCLNSFGNSFTSDNDDDGNHGCRVIWVMDGGHYGYKTPGSPRHWGEDVPGNVPKLVGTGNGSPCGIMVYEGKLLPREYSGCLFEADAGTRQINFFPLGRQGAAFRTEYKVLLSSDDPWFRPVDMAAAPDGSIFVADWYDSGVGGHAFRDQTTGRIYRVAPKGIKSQVPKVDFASLAGLIEALKSPVVATQDAARRSLIARGQEAVVPLSDLFGDGTPIDRARAFWVLHAIQGDAVAAAALKDRDPQIREQALRMLGRDVSRVGKVELDKPEAKPPATPAHLPALLPMASDADAGVRRELILALRDLPTAQAGPALKLLARLWDGQDRWYLEALGLALDNRESSFISELFDGSLYRELDLSAAGQATRVGLPPYFPVDRNEAFIATGAPDLPASALSKTLGLAWRVHRPEVLPLLERIMPSLANPDLQQAADDVMMQINDPRAALAMAELALNATDTARKRQILNALGRKLDGVWREARDHPKVAQVIKAALSDPATQIQAVQMIAATGDARYGNTLGDLAQDTKAPDEVRIAAVEALGTIKPPLAQHVMRHLIGSTKGRPNSNLVAEAAVRTLPRIFDAHGQLTELMMASAYPLGVRREALRTLARGEGGRRLIALAKDGKLPSELKTEATTALYTHPDRKIRDEAADVLPPPKTAAGRTLPPVGELLRREGNADQGRAVFFRSGTNACSSCHRVHGRGQWVGPDLSTIGTKYGKEELLRSILNPSASIGYSFLSYVVALKDGQVITGLPVDQTLDLLVLKTAEGKRLSLHTADIEDRKQSEVSLMPEGLAETMSNDDLVDLLDYLSTLRQPVSIVGQYHAAGPVVEKDALEAILSRRRVDLSTPLHGPGNQQVAWRRLNANAESLVDLTGLAGSGQEQVVFLYTPVVSPGEQPARLVLDTKAGVKAWLNGRKLALPAPGEDQTRSADVQLLKGGNDLLLCLPGGVGTSLVTTFVAAQTLEFSDTEAGKISAH